MNSGNPLPLRQQHIDWLLQRGVTVPLMVQPSAILYAGDCLYFQDDDCFWQPKTGHLSRWCLGEADITDPYSYSFDSALQIHADPIAWLQAGRNGIVVHDWSQAYEALRRVPRVSVPQALASRYRKAMKHPELPVVSLR